MKLIDCYLDENNEIKVKHHFFKITLPEIVLTKEEAKVRNIKIDKTNHKLKNGKRKVAWIKADGRRIVISVID